MTSRGRVVARSRAAASAKTSPAVRVPGGGGQNSASPRNPGERGGLDDESPPQCLVLRAQAESVELRAELRLPRQLPLSSHRFGTVARAVCRDLGELACVAHRRLISCRRCPVLLDHPTQATGDESVVIGAARSQPVVDLDLASDQGWIAPRQIASHRFGDATLSQRGLGEHRSIVRADNNNRRVPPLLLLNLVFSLPFSLRIL